MSKTSAVSGRAGSAPGSAGPRVFPPHPALVSPRAPVQTELAAVSRTFYAVPSLDLYGVHPSALSEL